MWRVCKEAGRSWPVLVPDDDVLDYMVMEAVCLKAREEDKKDEKAREIAQWKQEEMQRLKKLM